MPVWLKEWWPLIALMVPLTIAVAGWMVRMGLATRQDLAAETVARGAAIDAVEVMLSDRMSGLSNRMLAIEKEVQHLPTADDFAELRNEMTRVGTMVEASKREVESVGKAINRVEDWLIKRAP